MSHKQRIIYGVYALIFLFASIGCITVAVFVAMQFGLLNVRGSIDVRNAFFTDARAEATHATTTSTTSWTTTDEWRTVAAGLTKDRAVIELVAKETGVSARLITAVAVPEQLRFFTSNRDVFKRYFEPFKLLGTLSRFSLGVTGIKPETAERIEKYLHDEASPFYPDKKLAELLPASDDAARFTRLTDETDHYHQYLYTALFITEIEAQWKRAGHADALTPGIIVTLFNIGFDHSKPNATPQIGGATITLGEQTYAYGELGDLFYSSSELPFFE